MQAVRQQQQPQQLTRRESISAKAAHSTLPVQTAHRGICCRMPGSRCTAVPLSVSCTQESQSAAAIAQELRLVMRKTLEARRLTKPNSVAWLIVMRMLEVDYVLQAYYLLSTRDWVLQLHAFLVCTELHTQLEALVSAVHV